MNAPATIGHNRPDPFVLLSESIDDLLLEADNQLDGKGIENEEQEAAVASIFTRLRREAKAADDQRKIEKKPHDDAAKAVQAKWTPLLTRAQTALRAAETALASFLVKKEEAQRAAAEALRKEAEEKAAVAAKLAEDIAPDNLAGQRYLTAAKEEAASIAKEAAKADRERPQAHGGERAVGLRSVFTPTLTDACAALKHYRERQPAELKAWLLEQAKRDVRAGVRSIPGFTITEAKKAV
jgi:hypothetical protein